MNNQRRKEFPVYTIALSESHAHHNSYKLLETGPFGELHFVKRFGVGERQS